MVLVAAAAVWVLLGAGVGADQLDAIRTGSTLGIGLGGIVLLWLAVRRQRSTELDLLQKYEAHQLAERVAAAGERDATARRITELYAKAVDQLGSAQATVRLGGLYALERLAQDNPDPQLRQTVVNMLCAYLRMPGTEEEPHTVEQEREVRLTAQRILENHLKPGPDPDRPAGTFWSGMDLDLTGAKLVDLDLSRSRVRAARFSSAEFSQSASFRGAEFTALAVFHGSTFAGHAWFEGAHFHWGVNFGEAEFADATTFRNSDFSKSAMFDGATFHDFTEFGRAVFNGEAWFGEVSFAGGADFHKAGFAGEAHFEDTKFRKRVQFDDVTFYDGATFEGAEFTPGSTFAAYARVDGVESDMWWWPEGWAPGGEPGPVDGLPGMWVSLVRVDGESRVHDGA